MMTSNEYIKACQASDKLLMQMDPSLNLHDCAYSHGYLVATAISPEPYDANKIATYLSECDESTNEKYKSQLAAAIIDEIKSFDRLVNNEDEISDLIPDDRNTLEIWCSGFLDVHFEQQNRWLQAGEQQVSELLLPFMLLSGLFDTEPDFKHLIQDEKLLTDMHDQLEEVLIELYLLLRS